MSHTGNWHRSPRKMALETERSRHELERLEATREVVFEASEDKLLTLHPCATKAKKWHVTAACTCGSVRYVDLESFMTTFLAHAPWPRVMRHMKCEGCGGQPIKLAFSYTSSQLHQVEFGTIQVSLAPPSS